MKIGCDACGRAEAAVLCCADEAALCRCCDAAVHSANRLAGRHSRVELLPSSTGHSPDLVDGGGHPTCDICQEKTGYFFCVEDRALLCRPCDVAVHAAGAHVASHQRFLITGVRIGGGGVECHNVPGVVMSPSTSSGNGSSSAPSSSGNPTATMPDKERRAPSSPVSAAAAGEGRLDDQQWTWSEFLADDDTGVGTELCCPAGLSEPGSSSLTG
ncbi:unnamed protein product [Urochloa humidicola]